MSNFIKPNPLYAEKDTAFLTMSANQTTDLAVNGKIKFDTIEGNLNLVDNRITLKANTKYILHGIFRAYYSGASGYLQCSWYDYTNSVFLTGNRSANLSVSYPVNFDSGTGFIATITPTTDIEVEAKILYSVLPSYIASIQTSAWIESVETHIAVSPTDNPIGSIKMYAGSTAPIGWLICDGTAISRASYASLFTICSTTYGVGDGSTTFNIPNFQGIFPRGAGSQDIDGRTKGGGSLGDTNEDKMQGHIHTYWASASNQNVSNTNIYQGGDNQSASTTDPIADTHSNGTPRTGTTTEPSSVDINYIIKT